MRKIAAALLSGILLFCSFPPLEYYALAWIALIPLLFLCFSCQPRESFLYGLAAGAVFWLGSIAWLTRVSYIGWFFIGLYCACYPALFAMVVSWWHNLYRNIKTSNIQHPTSSCERKNMKFNVLRLGRIRSWRKSSTLNVESCPRWRPDLILLFGIPALWVSLEYVRAHFLTGFPWNLLGVSQYNAHALIQCADWGGVYIVSYLVVMGNTAFALMIYHRREGILKPAFCPVSFLLILFLSMQYGQWRLEQSSGKLETIRAVALQLNVPQQLKWSEEWAGDIYRRLQKATEDALHAEAPDLIVWPETALPDCLRSSGPSLNLVNEALCRGVPLLVGSIDVEDLLEKTNYFNSSFLFLPGWEEHFNKAAKATPEALPRRERVLPGKPQVYAKRHLVPFGEYVPLGNIFPFLRSISGVEDDFAPGTANVVFRLKVKNNRDKKFSVLICFEDILPYLARECVRAGARLLVNQTNDAWFDPSWASRQHMTHCVFRCIENRVACLRATNTGVTCYIDRLGRIQSALPPLGRERQEPEVLRTALGFSPENMSLTFYTRHGDIFALACTAFALPFFAGILLVFFRKRS